ncbi:HAD-IA family hydrolase [Pedobacter sp. SL55]|uniref:HAD-IA family hydrolase n=1 Tax=Pedobacter sp. SL55 TaxID=2995161 RepID=UPI00226F013D|nr:HAD-IA family hydrolase [Pedobacter sp. SL55]WAC42487.1 HAD-IA family hydrolase [Pedobacter sp. SL55]
MINEMTPAEVLKGTVNFLTAIKKEGYLVGLGSASKNSAIILERTNLTHFFDVIVDGNTVSKSKPDPEVFLKGAEFLGVEPQEALVFEDAIAGIEAAKRAGMRSVGIGQAEILTEATLVVEDLSKLSVAHLLQMNEL